MKVTELANRMRQLAENAKESEGEEVSVAFSPHDVKTITGWPRTSARREIEVGDELKKQGWGHRNQDGSFTVFSGDGWRSLSFSEALSAEEERDS